MRNMSFFATQNQIREGIKDVTRRVGWKTLKPGNMLQPVIKCQGLKKGAKVEKLRGPIMVVRVSFEPLYMIIYNPFEVLREGFADMSACDFVSMFCKMNKCPHDQVVTRIEFRYMD